MSNNDITESNHKTPFSLEAEQSVLASALIERQTIESVKPIIQSADFFKDAHRVIYEAITLLHDRDEPIDYLTVGDRLDAMGVLENVGGRNYLLRLLDAVPHAGHAEHYAAIVREKSILRGLIDAGNQIVALGFGEYDDINQVLAACGKALGDVAERQMRGHLPSIRQQVACVFEKLEYASERTEGLSGIPTGLGFADLLTDGWQPGHLILICARPGVGKSALSVNTFANAALNHKNRVAIFSLEMTYEEVISRYLASTYRVSGTKMRAGTCEDDDWRRIGEGCSNLSELPLWIDDSPEQTPSSIRARLREIERRDGKVDLIIVDYLLLITPETQREKGHQEVNNTTKALKRIAKEFRAPLILLHQLNKEIDHRADPQPVLADAKEGGEADADIVLFLWRDRDQEGVADGFERIWLTTGKNRHGAKKDIPLMFEQTLTRFGQMVGEDGSTSTRSNPQDRRSKASTSDRRHNSRSPYRED